MTQTNKLSEKTILITGASDGIGRETARILAAKGARLILHGRNPEKLGQVIAQIREESGNDKLVPVLTDFSSMEEVRRMGVTLLQSEKRLDVLINNAGLMTSRHQQSVDGYELTFAVNYLAPFLLTNLLRPLLTGSAPARVVNLSSIGHYLVSPQLKGLPNPKLYWGWVAYCRSKGYLILFTRALAERTHKDGVTVNCVHPGVITSTKLIGWSWLKAVDLHEGAEAVVNLAINPQVEQVTGQYFSRKRLAKPRAEYRDPRRQAALWDLSLGWCQLKPE